jgi:glycosyltransferase involved in cell wall biosynthesis
MNRHPRVVLVSHEASRTGAVRIALQTLEALSAIEVERVAVIKHAGPLVEEFQRVADAVIVEPHRFLSRVARATRPVRLGNWQWELGASLVLRRLKPDVVWANTVISADFIRPALATGARAVLQSHETGRAVRVFAERHRLRSCVGSFTPLACSSAARTVLSDALGVDEAAIEVLQSSVDTRAVMERASSAPALRSDGRHLVVACGTVNRRKGADLFIDVAAATATASSGCVQFVWIGDGPELTRSRADVVRRGLDGVVEFIGEVEHPATMMARADVFVMPSRREAFPLVTLEAMALGRAVVSFDSEGASEVLGESAGIIVGAGDVDRMAHEILTLLADGDRRRDVGARAFARVRERYDVSVFARQVREMVGSLINGSEAK